jgi:predicted nucleotidyltransferase
MAAITTERRREVERLLTRAREWAARRSDIRALCLVGSWARDDARMDSDVDLVLLTADLGAYTADEAWVRELGGERIIRTRPRGAVTERRFALAGGLEVDVGVGTTAWASLTPMDAGTRHVVGEGMRVLHDPEGILAELVRAVRLG